MQKIKDFIKQYKKPILIGVGILVAIFVIKRVRNAK